MRKTVLSAFAAALALTASAFEKFMMRIPDALNPKEGTAGVQLPVSDAAVVAIPLKDGAHLVVWNNSNREKDPKGVGVAKNVTDRNAVTLIRAAAEKCPTIFVNVGGSTFFSFFCGACGAYEGVLVSKGAAYEMSLFLPKGREFDDEIRGILRQIEFVPPPCYGIDTALKLYGAGSKLAAGTRYTVLKKMVEARPEVWELVDALKAVSDGHPETAAWCDAQLRRINPAAFDPESQGKRSVRGFDPKVESEMDASLAILKASGTSEKTTVKVP